MIMKRSQQTLLVLLSIIWRSSGFAPTSKNARAIFRKSELRINAGLMPAQSSQMLGATPPKRGSMLYMHGGHSHGHHDRAHDGTKEVAVSAGAGRMKKRRQAALFLFVTLAILGPPLVRNRMLGRSDVAAFLFTSTALFTFDNVRREVKAGIRKIRGFRDGIVKHSPYQVSPGGVLNYLFRNDNAADRVTLLGGVINLVLSCGKFAVGISCHSSALIADAGHSLSDLFSDFITLWAVQVGRLPPDDDHPYGHGKFEAVGSLFLALTLLGTGISVGAVSNRKLIEIIQIQRASGFNAVTSGLAGNVPTAPALIMAALSIFSKEWLYRITRQVGEKLNSQIVIANAWHHRSDAYSSILALIAIGLAMYFPVFIAADSAAGLLVAGMICMTGAEIMGESIKQLTDTSNVALVEQVSDLAAGSPDVFDVKRVRARQVGSSAIVDVAITTHGDLPSSASRNIEEKLRLRIIEETGAVDAEVHATTKDVVCPLLMATDNNNSSESLPPTNSEIEHDVRQQILLTAGVDSVQGITVRYADSILTNVDVVIRVDPEASVANANTVADELRKSLENLDKINKASIFLDLNQNSAATVAVVVPPVVAESVP
jgi:cation diffusion facilitator family transporter